MRGTYLHRNVPNLPAKSGDHRRRTEVVWSAAYYLRLMGHQTTVFAKMHRHLGGMLYYGIPSYRLPRERLDEDINTILSTGVEVKLRTFVGDGEDQVSISDLREMYDAVYISIGAHTDKR